MMLDNASRPGLMDMALDDFRAGLQGHFFTSVDLVEIYLRRIEEVNRRVRAITEVDPTALAQARLLDEERAGGKIRRSRTAFFCPVILS